MSTSGTRTHKPRVLVIGLDSADAELIDSWCAQGYLPTIQGLRQQGTWGRLGTTAEVMHVSAWPTIYTGTYPGKHGMYHAYQIKAGEQEVHRTRAEECAQLPFWKFLDDAGKKCIVMDAFMDYRLDGFQGLQILEYGTWTWFTTPASTPKALYKEIVRRFGPYPAPEHTQVLHVPEPQHFRNQLSAGAKVKARVVQWLLHEQPWDMLFVTFGEPHAAGHYLWHVEDTSYPSHPTPGMAELAHCVRDVYTAVDAAIGDIIGQLDDSVAVLITSGDGMGPNFSGCHLVPEVLHRLDLFYAANVGKTGLTEGAQGKVPRPRKSILSAMRDAVPLPIRHAVTRCLPHNLHYKLSMKWANANIDWSRSKAFCIPNANEAYLRVNLSGREPQGIVSPGMPYDELMAMLEAELRQLVNPQNGKAATQDVFRTDEVFPGPQRTHLPDVVVTWNPHALVLADLSSERCGLVHKQAGYEIAPYYTGNHRPNAFVLARGPSIRENHVLTEGHIVDLAPTILALLGVEPPAHVDGRVWSRFVA